MPYDGVATWLPNSADVQRGIRCFCTQMLRGYQSRTWLAVLNSVLRRTLGNGIYEFEVDLQNIAGKGGFVRDV